MSASVRPSRSRLDRLPLDRPPLGRLRRGTMLALAIWLALLLPWDHSLPASPTTGSTVSAHAEGAGLAGYRLVETLGAETWEAAAGRFGDAADLASAPDGRIFVLDRRQNALHIMAADGRPLARVSAPIEAPWRWIRLDMAPDGRPLLLARGAFADEAGGPDILRYRLDVLSGAAALQRSLDLGAPAPERYIDLAASPDGRAYLVRTNGNVASRGNIRYAVDILSIDGDAETRTSWTPDLLYIPLEIEIGADGRIYLIDQFPHTGQAQPPGTVDGIHIYSAEHSPLEVIQFSGAMDLAIAADGTLYVTRNREIYRLGDRLPFHLGPPIQKNPYDLTPLGIPDMFSLDVAPDGRVLASMTHCSWQGLLLFDPARISGASAPGAPDPLIARIGELDAPELAGPIHPYRIDAERGASLLQARYEPWWLQKVKTSGGHVVAEDTIWSSQLYSEDPQSIQRWNSGGAASAPDASQDNSVASESAATFLQSQAAACGVWNAPFNLRDLAVDGADTYTLDFHSLKRRLGNEPEGDSVFGFQFLDDILAPVQLLAISADAGRAAVLDAGSQSVALVDRALAPLANWPYIAGEAGPWAPTDIAHRGDTVALIARGDRRVMRFDRSGQALAQWWEERAPFSVAIGPAGELILLTEGGWLVRRGPDGHREALWRVPEPAFALRDLAVDDAGRVYLAWLSGIEPVSGLADIDTSQQYLLGESGIWVFEPSLAYEPIAQEPAQEIAGADERPCSITANRTASPQSVALGESVDIELSLDAACQSQPGNRQLILILDTAKSMNNDNGLDRAKRAVTDLLGRLSPSAGLRVAVIAYDGRGGARLASPLSADIGTARSAVAALEADGESGLATALSLAAALFESEGIAGQSGAVLWVTDGSNLTLGDDPTRALTTLEQAGIRLYTQLHPFRAIRSSHLQALRALVDPARIFAHQGPESMDMQAAALSGSQAGINYLGFQSLHIEDQLAEGMNYIAGSAEPPATWDPATGSLSWDLGPQSAAKPPRLRYQLRPSRMGSWQPISHVARATVELEAELGPFTLGLPNPALRVRGAGEALLPALIREAP